MSKQKNQQDPLVDMFDALKETPERDPARTAKGREQFLAQAKQISGQTVSVSWLSRLKDVFGPARPALQLSTLTIALVIGMLLLGFSSSVVAAQQAQPDQFLYPYRLWLENQRQALTSNPESRVKLHLQYAEDRLEELHAASYTPGDPGYDRTTTNLDRQISAANTLLLQSQLNGSLKEKLVSLDEEYRDLFGVDPDELDDELESPDESNKLDQVDGLEDKDEDLAGSEESNSADSSKKYEKELEDTSANENDHGDNHSNNSDDSGDSNGSDDSDHSDGSNDDRPDETKEPDSGKDSSNDSEPTKTPNPDD